MRAAQVRQEQNILEGYTNKGFGGDSRIDRVCRESRPQQGGCDPARRSRRCGGDYLPSD